MHNPLNGNVLITDPILLNALFVWRLVKRACPACVWKCTDKLPKCLKLSRYGFDWPLGFKFVLANLGLDLSSLHWNVPLFG